MTPDELKGKIIAAQKKIKQKRRCLHYDTGENCNHVIRAHSIQNNNQLSDIAEDGHVYMLDGNFTSLSRNSGKVSFTTKGINQASTFYGFCGHHDNETFKPIDDFPLEPSDEQIALHIYRCVCKETYEKENALELHSEVAKITGLGDVARQRNMAGAYGVEFGLRRIRHHKEEIEDALKQKDYSKFNGVTFFMTGEQFMCFSGVTLPLHDYYGNELQNLMDDAPLDELAFFTAPATDGWTITLAWHGDNCQTNLKLFNSMKARFKEGVCFSTLIARLLFTTMENYALNISWLDNLPEYLKEEIIETFTRVMSPVHPIQSDVLCKGFEENAFFEVKGVIQTNMDQYLS